MLPCPGIQSKARPKSPIDRVFGPTFPFVSFVQDNVTTQEEDPHGF